MRKASPAQVLHVNDAANKTEFHKKYKTGTYKQHSAEIGMCVTSSCFFQRGPNKCGDRCPSKCLIYIVPINSIIFSSF